MTYTSHCQFKTAAELMEYFLNDGWFKTDDLQGGLAVGRNKMIFRGQSNSEWPLKSSAFRENALQKFVPQPPPSSWDKCERRIALGSFLHSEVRAVSIFLESADSLGIRTPIDFNETRREIESVLDVLNDRDFNVLREFPSKELQKATALAQHHGVPTRYLDWSESPFIAAYFAANRFETINIHDIHERLEIAIFYTTTFNASKEGHPIQFVQAPKHENSNMRAQQGIFTNIKNANGFFMENGQWPSVEDVLASSGVQVQVATLPAVESKNLLKRLYDLGITRHSLMPSLDNAAKSFQYTQNLFGTLNG